jgi:hypothetical protein
MTLPQARRRRRSRRRACELATILVMALLTGCSTVTPVAARPHSPAASDPATSAEQQKIATPPIPKPKYTPLKDQATAPPTASAQSAPTTGLTESFASLSRRLDGSIGLAYAPVGLGQPAKSLGDLHAGVGWSTMKIPVAIANVKRAQGHPTQDTLRLMRLAITQSDNDAAMALWSRLGSPTAAAAQTQDVLREGGDAITVVPAERLRAGFTPFGQSNWSLAAQATFAASLSCMANTGPVLELMGQVTPSQRWGVGAINATVAFKGGWGPGTDGAYLVRQMAVVRLVDGSRIGLALASRPADGRFGTGVSDLNALARWAAANIRTGGANRC